MTMTARALTAALNREIVDDQPDRLSIHTHEILLTQAHLPYQPAAGKRLRSEKHFAVYADRITLDGALQNPGRDIELHAREIVIRTPATLDVAGAWPDKDFKPGEPATQKDAAEGAAGTDGENATVGGPAGSIAIHAQRVVNATSAAGALTVTDTAALASQTFSEHPPKVDDATALPTFEVGRTSMFGNEAVITLEEGRVEGLSHVTLTSSSYDGGSGRIGVRLSLPALTITGRSQFSGNARISSKPFACTIDAMATLSGSGAIEGLQSGLSLVAGAPIKLPIPFVDGTLSTAALTLAYGRVAAQLEKQAIEPLLKAFGGRLRAAALTLLASGARGGRGQDGHAGNRGEGGSPGATTSQNGVVTDGGAGFPEAAYGRDGLQGGRAGSAGLSANGGRGGAIALNVMEPLALPVIYSVAGGEGGSQARTGDRGPGGRGGTGAVCQMYEAKTGRPVEDMKAPDGKEGPPGPPATSDGSKGGPGDAGRPLQINGAPFTGAAAPACTFADLAPALSLSQLLITQNATDQDFLNAADDAARTAAAGGYVWLIEINQPFTGSPTGIEPARVPLPEQKVRARIHDSAVVSLMRLQQGLDYYGHSYNWTPVLNLTNLVARTDQLISLGKVVEDQFNRYVDKGKTDKQRMQAFGQAKQEIDRKLAEFTAEIERLAPQITSFETEVAAQSEALRLQRTVLVEGQLKFKEDLIAYLRKENDLGFDDFLDMLGTVIGCVGGAIQGIGGIRTAIDAVKKAEGFSKQVKSVVEIFKKAKATIGEISKAYSSVKDLIDGSNPNAAKILVDGEAFDTLLKEYLDKVDSAGELRKAMEHYVRLAQARNMAAYNYSTLVAQALTLQVQHDQLYDGIQHVNAEIAANQDNVLPIYTAYLRDAVEDVQRTLLRNIYQENRAYQYWALRDRQLQTSDLNVATLAATHERLMADIDGFRENNEAFSDFRQKVVISAERYPNEFAALAESRRLTFELDIRREPGFRNMRFIIARAFTLELPEVDGGSNVLFLNFIHSGQAVLNSDTNVDAPGARHVFSHRPRVGPYKIDYGDRRNTAGGNLGEDSQGYIGLSPFTVWRIDFGVAGNEWLDLGAVKTVELTFSGRMLGPNARPH